MDVGEADFPEQLDVSGDIPSCGFTNSFLDEIFMDEIFKDTVACTHAHTCEPGPDSSHTHRCYHVHTKLVQSMDRNDDDKTPTDDTAESTEKKRMKLPLGNREAVRRYREKKKAQAASLEDEVIQLRALNQQLMKRIQNQSGLEAEAARFKCLLVDIKGRIEGEIRSFPYQNQQTTTHNVPNMNLTSGYVMNPCNMQCGDQSYCLHPSIDGETGEGGASVHDPFLNGCEFENLQCLGNQSSILNELPECGAKDSFVVVTTSRGTKRKGAHAARSK